MGARHRGGRRSACPKAHGIPAHRTAPGKGRAGSVIQGDQTGIYPLRAWLCKHPLPHTPVHQRIRAFEGCSWTTRDSYHRREKPGKGCIPHPPDRRGPVLRSDGFPRPPLGLHGQEEHARRRPSTRGVRGLRSLGSGGAGRQPRLLRALRPPAPRPGVRRDGRRRRPRRARLQGDGPGQPGVRRADAGHPPGAPGHRPHPLLDHRRLPLGERPAGVQDQRRRRRDRPGPQRQPHQHGRPGRVAGPGGAGRRRRRAAAEQRHRRDGRAAGPRGRPVAGGGDRPHHAPPRGGVLAGHHGRADPLRGAGPPRGPARCASASCPGAG